MIASGRSVVQLIDFVCRRFATLLRSLQLLRGHSIVVPSESGIAVVIAIAIGNQKHRVLVAVRKYSEGRNLPAIVDIPGINQSDVGTRKNQGLQIDDGAVFP